MSKHENELTFQGVCDEVAYPGDLIESEFWTDVVNTANEVKDREAKGYVFHPTVLLKGNTMLIFETWEEAADYLDLSVRITQLLSHRTLSENNVRLPEQVKAVRAHVETPDNPSFVKEWEDCYSEYGVKLIEVNEYIGGKQS